MFEIKGKVNTAICYASVIEEEAVGQILRMCNYEFTRGSRIRIMPDAHAGKGCTIGMTMTIMDKAVPNLVGVDIGCGMYTVTLGKGGIDMERLDAAAHYIPSQMNVWEGCRERFDLTGLRCYQRLKELRWVERSLGTLGGGNHFIEVDVASDGTKYLIIHSGSRNLGKQVAEYYQRLAVDLCRSCEADVPEDLCFLSGAYLEDYLHDVEICQRFARRNRELMTQVLTERAGLECLDAFHTVHNYIDTREMILRKGAVAAHAGERVLIPINMRDGSILAVGKGNPEWNCSAPHGAGRIMSRSDAKARLDLEEYRREMEGVYTTSVSAATIDEAPMAYKSLEDILDDIAESVDVIEVLRPIYNFKAG